MRKLYFLLIAVLLACLCFSCNPEGGTERTLPKYTKADYLLALGSHAGLEEDTEWQIVDAYYQKLQSSGKNGKLTINDIWIEKYFGAYCPYYITWLEQVENGKTWEEVYYAPENQTVIAVMMGAQDQDNGAEVSIVGYGINRGFVKGGDRIFLWEDGQLYTLADNKKNTQTENNNGILLCHWDFLGIANLQNGLDSETQLRIQEDYSKEFLSHPWPPEYYNEITLRYLGTYNDYITAISPNGTNADILHLIIDDVHFYSSSGGDILFAWQEGEIYSLQKLYEQDLITHKDLVNIAFNLHAGKKSIHAVTEEE